MSDARSPESAADIAGAAIAATQQGEKPVSAAADSRDARIAPLREQYRAGTYEVNTAKVSAKIIDDHLRK